MTALSDRIAKKFCKYGRPRAVVDGWIITEYGMLKSDYVPVITGVPLDKKNIAKAREWVRKARAGRGRVTLESITENGHSSIEAFPLKGMLKRKDGRGLCLSKPYGEILAVLGHDKIVHAALYPNAHAVVAMLKVRPIAIFMPIPRAEEAR